ncbi:MAG: acetoacetate--CoA ligase [Pseudomonadota bacterium]
MTENPVLWTPSDARRDRSAMQRFMRGQGFDSYDALYRWSTDDVAAFWPALAEFCDVRFTRQPDAVVARPDNIMDAGWFDGATLNYAEHLLRHDGSRAALVFRGEDGARRSVSFDELREQTAAIAAGLRAAGVAEGDRVAGFLPNGIEAIVAMLATTSLGAVWSSCSPDFGANGVVDRFGQIEPRILFTVDGYFYNGKPIDIAPVVADIAGRVPCIREIVVADFAGLGSRPACDTKVVDYDDFKVDGAALEFVAVPFNHPLFIMYSSGTTGAPKCIVHGHGGTLLQHLKEHVLHTDLDAADTLFYFTTCGWMMWNWLASGLASGSTLVLFDGSPFYDDGKVLWRIAAEEGITVFGTSAKYLSALETAGVRPRDLVELPELRAVLSTGSPLAPRSFDFVYDAIGDDLQLSSIAGGTDILSCFILGNPVLPVRRGELQCRGLGMAVEIFDDEGNALTDERGELVCTRPFPSAPVGFWNDPENERYRSAYFERFPGIWAHGDFAELKSSGGVVIHGRSDAILNPGGVRIGTAEIYRQVEKLSEVVESIAIGQRWEDDVRVVLFVVLREGSVLDESLEALIRKTIRANTTPRHVPAKIVAVPEIPRTRSGKIVEIAVRSVVHGETVQNTEALANPDALRHFANRPELEVE